MSWANPFVCVVQVQVERDDLYKKFTQAIQEVQQKSGFKNLLLERKLGALTNTPAQQGAVTVELWKRLAPHLISPALWWILDTSQVVIQD